MDNIQDLKNKIKSLEKELNKKNEEIHQEKKLCVLILLVWVDKI